MAAKTPATKKVAKLTKSQIISELSDKTGLTKKDVGGLLAAIPDLAKRELTKRGGAGQFVIPDLVRIRLSDRKARKGRNPATGEEIQIPAKRTVKANAVKRLKDSVLGK